MEYSVTFKMGSSMQVIGPTSTGKSWFITRMLDYSKTIFDVVPKYVYWFYGERTQLHDLFLKKKYNMYNGIPEDFDFVKNDSVLVFDDLMRQSESNEKITNLFTTQAHHKNLFVIFVSQNLYHKSKESRDRTLNTQYFVLFKNARDLGQIKILANQIHSENSKLFLNAYLDATSVAHSYLLVDLHSKTEPIVKLRSRVLPDEAPMITYVDKRRYVPPPIEYESV